MGVGKHRQGLKADMNLKCWVRLKDGYQPMGILDKIFKNRFLDIFSFKGATHNNYQNLKLQTSSLKVGATQLHQH